MNENWPTKEKDLKVADKILEHHALTSDFKEFGIVELSLEERRDVPDFKISAWVLKLAAHFYSEYGKEEGDRITKMVITQYLTKGHTVH